jgi:hypothetical protein
MDDMTLVVIKKLVKETPGSPTSLWNRGTE